jgi:outer membrane immunogenic protein
MIRSILLAAASTLVLASVAVAADLPSDKGPPVYAPPPPPAFSWTGFYVGGQVGYGWGTSDSAATVFIPAILAPGGFVTFANTTNTSGILGGGHIGYNYQLSQFVFGIEGDANGSSERGSVTLGNGDIGFGDKEFDASIRARVGIAFDRVLVYATGGGEYGDFRVGVTDPGVATETHFPGHFGWTVGGGVEYAIDNNWSVRAEYRYTDYGHYDLDLLNTSGGLFSDRFHDKDNRIQAGFSYRFDMFVPPPPPIVAKY